MLQKGDKLWRARLLWTEAYSFTYSVKYFKYREGPVPFIGHSNDNYRRYTPKNKCGALRTMAINCDEDHAPFARNHGKECRDERWRSDMYIRSWKNRKLRHQWEVHLSK